MSAALYCPCLLRIADAPGNLQFSLHNAWFAPFVLLAKGVDSQDQDGIDNNNTKFCYVK